MIPTKGVYSAGYSTTGWLQEQVPRGHSEAYASTPAPRRTTSASNTTEHASQSETSRSPTPQHIEAVPASSPPLCRTIIVLHKIPNDSFGDREMPFFSCIPPRRLDTARTESVLMTPLCVSQLSFQMLCSNIPLVGQNGVGLAYIVPGQDRFVRIDNDSSFQAAVMRMRDANYRDIDFFHVDRNR